MAAATIVHDTSEAMELCPSYGLYLKPITKMTISVALPQLKQPGKSISNWEVMERLKSMVQNHQFSTLRISKSTMDFIRFEGEVENKSLVKAFLASLDGKTIKLSGFSDILKVRAAEYKIDFPTRHDWDSFFRDAKDMNETLPGERPDTIHLEGLPCKWFAVKDSGSEKPSEEVLIKVFKTFGEIRNVDIPMLDPYREEMTGRNFHTFSFGGHLNFEAYVQYNEYVGFMKAMNALRGMKLMYKGEDGKAVACNIKVSFDSTKHLSDASIKKRQLERQKLQELEQKREEHKRKEREAEQRQKEEERKQKELAELEKQRKREQKLRRKEQKQKEREARRNQRRLEKLQAEEQKRLEEKIKFEERKLLLAQRNLESIKLIAELLSRAKAAKLLELEQKAAERLRLQQLEARRKQQEAELRRVEEEKQRALELQRKERELREKLLNNLLNKNSGILPQIKDATKQSDCGLLKSDVNVPQTLSSSCVSSTSVQAFMGHAAQVCEINGISNQDTKSDSRDLNGILEQEACVKEVKKLSYSNSCPGERQPAALTSIPAKSLHQGSTSNSDQSVCGKEICSELVKCDKAANKKESQAWKDCSADAAEQKRKHKRELSSEADTQGKAKRRHKKHSSKGHSSQPKEHESRSRNLESIKLIAELLSRAKAAKLLELEQKAAERLRLQQLEARRKQQEAELRRVEEEKQRALELQRKERELREKLLNNLLNKNSGILPQIKDATKQSDCGLLKSDVNVPQTLSSSCVSSTSVQAFMGHAAQVCEINGISNQDTKSDSRDLNGILEQEACVKEVKKLSYSNSCPGERQPAALTSIPAKSLHQGSTSNSDQSVCGKEICSELVKCDKAANKKESQAWKDCSADAAEQKRKHKRELSSEADTQGKAKRRHKKHSSKGHSSHRKSTSPDQHQHKRTPSNESKKKKKEKSHTSKKRSRRRRSLSKERSSWSR
ncbi:LOW QUALITY PROTEIN: A-kinase anchor protein 17A [Rhinatrema bivittatum]|uniref:LOW QUALITY PROTEIN: A-kinase anchor protein 17A n=1 Tax=Rhinatrema bivittatum TaxID=194408 RepID=UPI00112A54D7|nr:LOW QUALITY PROTEIN: A-kinase anchor protein 17A [Rhinatrema bivittatum]